MPAATSGSLPNHPPPVNRNEGIFRRVLLVLPGIVAGAADLDPAAVMTATVVGATYRLSAAWVIFLSFPVLQTVFAVSARIGQQTRRGLIELVGIRYGF